MKNILTVLLVLIFANNCFSQKLNWVTGRYKYDNSAETETKLNNAKNNLDKAYKAYSENDLDQTIYSIHQSEREGIKPGEMYFLLGCYMYRTNEMKAAKRYWKIAYKEGGCYECIKLYENLENEALIQDITSKKVNEYLSQE